MRAPENVKVEELTKAIEYFSPTIIQYAVVAVKNKDSFFHAQYQRLEKI